MARPKGAKNKTNEERGLVLGKTPGVATLIASLKNGMTVAEIARVWGVSPQTVHHSLRKHGVDVRALRNWQERKADVLSHVQMRVVEHMTTKKIENASLRDQATTFNILHNAERLERGQSTSNVSMQALLENAAEMDKQIAALEASLGLKSSETANPESEDPGLTSNNDSVDNGEAM